MNPIETLFDEYLSYKTDYVFLLNGKWGIGKTHFFKTVLEPNIKQKRIYDNQAKFYKTIYISLYGLKTIEDIQYEIFISITNNLIGKKLKPSKNLISALSKGILKFNGFESLYDIASELGKSSINKIDLSDLVICFDDLERKHGDLKIKEFLGYVNNLVEHKNAKILIIANEDILKDTSFKDYKEKTIGISTYFKLNFKEAIINIINNLFDKENFSELNSFLHDNINSIIDFNNKDEINIRSLNFAFKKFEIIFNLINKSEEKIITNYKNKILFETLKFTILISLEYRKGHLDSNKTNELDTIFHSYSAVYFNELFENKNKPFNEKKELSYSEKFIQYYYSNETFNFYPSIFHHVTGKENFILNNFIEEYKEKNYIVEHEILEQYKVLSLLSYPNFYNLEDEKYLSLISKMREFTEQGQYHLEHYIIIYKIYTRFENTTTNDKETISKEIIKGIEKAHSNNNLKYIAEIESKINISDAIDAVEKKIIEKTHEINAEIWERMKKEKAISFQELLLNDINQLKQLYILDETRNSYLTRDSFKYMNPDLIFKNYQNSNNLKRRETNEFFNVKMNQHKNIDEHEFFITLNKLIEKEIKSTNEIIYKQLLIDLNKIFKNSLEN